MKKIFIKLKDLINLPLKKWIEIAELIDYKESQGGCVWMLLKIPLALIGVIMLFIPFVLGTIFCVFLGEHIHPYVGWTVAGILALVYFLFFHSDNGDDFYLGDDTGD